MNRVCTFFLIIMYKILLDLGYLIYVYPNFSYQGFHLDISVIKYIFSIIVLFTVFFIFIKESVVFSNIIMNMLFLILIIPFTSLYALENQPTEFFIMVIFGFIITLTITRLKSLKTVKLKVTSLLLPFILIACSILTYGSLFVFNGIPTLTALNLFRVYEVRSAVNYGPAIFPYLISWQAKVINPFLIGYGLLFKRKAILAIGVGLQFLIFIYTGHKSYLFAPIVIIGVVYFVKKRALLIGALLGLNSVLVLGISLYKYLGDHFVATLFIRRTMFIPAKNYYIYFDFFSSHDKIYLSHSIFRIFLDYPYVMPVPNLIGALYYNNPNTWVNVGYLAESYMNFGFLGIVLYSVILGFVLKFFDSLSTNIGVEIVLMTSFIAFFGLLSGALLTTFLTGGIIFSYIILNLYNNQINKI